MFVLKIHNLINMFWSIIRWSLVFSSNVFPCWMMNRWHIPNWMMTCSMGHHHMEKRMKYYCQMNWNSIHAISCYAHTCMNNVHIVCICREILPPLDNVAIELCWIMASKIEDVGLWYQICEHETIDEFHNIT